MNYLLQSGKNTFHATSSGFHFSVLKSKLQYVTKCVNTYILSIHFPQSNFFARCDSFCLKCQEIRTRILAPFMSIFLLLFSMVCFLSYCTLYLIILAYFSANCLLNDVLYYSWKKNIRHHIPSRSWNCPDPDIVAFIITYSPFLTNIWRFRSWKIRWGQCDIGTQREPSFYVFYRLPLLSFYNAQWSENINSTISSPHFLS